MTAPVVTVKMVNAAIRCLKEAEIEAEDGCFYFDVFDRRQMSKAAKERFELKEVRMGSMGKYYRYGVKA